MNCSKIKEEAANQIVEMSKFTAAYSVMALNCGIYVPAALYRNLRDAMVHFKALVDSINNNNDDQTKKHYFNLLEHLIRGEKDAVITYIQCALKRINEIVCLHQYQIQVSLNDKKSVEKMENELKNILIDVRLMGLNLISNEKDTVNDLFERVNKLAYSLNELLSNYGWSLF